MALTRDEVLHVANLARLSLVPAEIELFTRQLNDILAYVEKLQELDTGDTEQKVGLGNVKDLPGDEGTGEIFYPFGGLCEFLVVHRRGLFKDPVAIMTLRARGLIAILCLKMREKSLQLTIIKVNELAELQIKDLP